MYGLSIITINRNNANGLRHTMESVYTQRYTEFEYIVIDGGSTDGSIGVLDIQSSRFEDQGRQVQIISEPDTGIYNAMNKGLKLSTGEYCLFLNSGDCLKDEYVLEKVLPWLNDADVYYADAILEQGEGRTLKRTYPDELTLHFFYNDSLCHQTTFYKRELLQQVGGYNETYQLIADWVMNVQLFRKKNLFKHIPIEVACYDMQGMTSGSVGLKKCLVERERYYTENGLRYIHHWMWIQRKWNNLLCGMFFGR